MNDTKAHILYVEDDITLSYVTCDNLELKGYNVIHCKDGKEALSAFEQNEFDICIFDVMLPEMDGFTLAKHIRENNQHVPILFLTAKTSKEDKIHGLKLGGDDYIIKPFSIEELILKIEIFLRRSKVSSILPNDIITLGCYEFDYKNLTIVDENDTKQLTQKEADLLNLFIQNKGQVLKRNYILQTLWGDDDYFTGRSLDVFISRLRKYLKRDKSIVIENIHGVGFKLKI